MLLVVVHMAAVAEVLELVVVMAAVTRKKKKDSAAPTVQPFVNLEDPLQNQVIVEHVLGYCLGD
jgi:hypothetical protein